MCQAHGGRTPQRSPRRTRRGLPSGCPGLLLAVSPGKGGAAGLLAAPRWPQCCHLASFPAPTTPLNFGEAQALAVPHHCIRQPRTKRVGLSLTLAAPAEEGKQTTCRRRAACLFLECPAPHAPQFARRAALETRQSSLWPRPTRQTPHWRHSLFSRGQRAKHARKSLTTRSD